MTQEGPKSSRSSASIFVRGNSHFQQISQERNSRPQTNHRKRTSVACESCRLRKTRCDAAKPACSLCARLELPCVYKFPTRDIIPQKTRGTTTSARLDKIETALHNMATVLGLSESAGSPNLIISPSLSLAECVTNTSPATASTGPSTQTRSSIPRMPNVQSFKTTDPWGYDCDGDFFLSQMDSISGVGGHRPPEAMPGSFEPSHLYRLRQVFAEKVLMWLPLFDQDSMVKHLRAAHRSRYEKSSPSLCLAYLVFAIGSLAEDERPYVTAMEDVLGYGYYVKAQEVMSGFPSFSKNLCMLQCWSLVAIYFLYAMRPLESWKHNSQVAQNCIVLLKALDMPFEPPQYRDAFQRIYWITYVLDSEFQVCLELPPSDLWSYHESVTLPISLYEEEGMYCLLAMTSLRKLMVEVVNTIALKGSPMAKYSPVVILELGNQIEDWYRHLPVSLRVSSTTTPNNNNSHRHHLAAASPPTDSLRDSRAAHIKYHYHALKMMLFWPFVPRCKEIFDTEAGSGGSSTNPPPFPFPSASFDHAAIAVDETERITQGAQHCLGSAREYLRDSHDVMTQKTVCSHLILRSYFTMASILLFIYPYLPSADGPERDRTALEDALLTLGHWKTVPFMEVSICELERIARLKDLAV